MRSPNHTPTPSLRRRWTAALDQAPRLRFLVVFALSLGAVMALFSQWQELFSRLYLQPVCEVSAALLNAVGVAARLDTGPALQGYCTIAMAHVTFRVIHECTGIFTLFIYLAAVSAYPTAARYRLAGALAGSGAFFLYSAARLVVLGAVSHLEPAWLPHLHAWLMVLTNLGFALFIWLVWVERMGDRGRH